MIRLKKVFARAIQIPVFYGLKKSLTLNLKNNSKNKKLILKLNVVNPVKNWNYITELVKNMPTQLSKMDSIL